MRRTLGHILWWSGMAVFAIGCPRTGMLMARVGEVLDPSKRTPPRRRR